MFLARTPTRARRLALGMCLAASLALSACGPAHKGQLSVEPAGASADTWHQFLFSTRVAGLDAGAMG